MSLVSSSASNHQQPTNRAFRSRKPETTQWSFCPSLPAAYLFVILFGLTLCAHIAQAIIHRKGYSWVIITSALLQFLAYFFRIRSIDTPDNETVYILWFVFILVWIIRNAARVEKKLMILDCPNIYQCLHLHGGGPDDLQLYFIRQDHEDQSLAIRLIFRTTGNPVSGPTGMRGLVRHG